MCTSFPLRRVLAPALIAAALWLVPGALLRGQPAAPAASASDSFEGNWYVDYLDFPKNGEKVRVCWSFQKERELLGNGRPDPSGDDHPHGPPGWFWSYRVRPGAGLRNFLNSGGPHPDVGSDGTLTIKLSPGDVGPAGGSLTVKLVGRNEARGRWVRGNRSGEVIWRRAVPRVTEIEFRLPKENDKVASRVSFGGETGRVELPYDESYYARGNRPPFKIRIFGENLWGSHIAVVEGLDVEGHGCSPIIGPGAATPDRPNAIGVEMYCHIWPMARTGRAWIHLDDIRIPFDLVVTGQPTPAPVADVRFVRQAEGKFVAAPSLKHGDQFYVEAFYAQPPAAPPHTVQVSWTDGETREVELRPTDTPAVFRSGPLRLEAPVARTR